jgi:signal peptidase
MGTICSMLLAVVLFSICTGLVAIRTLGMGTFVVAGGSMEPTIHQGSLAIVQPVPPTLVQRGDIITFDHDEQTTTHRVIAIDASGATPLFKTQGDANVAADPEPLHFPGQVGLYRASIPLLGYLVAYVQAYWRLALMLIAAAIFLVCASRLVFGNARPARRVRAAGARVPVDPEELWSSHVGWLRERIARRVAA